MKVPVSRIRAANTNSPDSSQDFVLYWMTSFRRLQFNYSLQRAVEWCRELNKPLLVLEAVRADYEWASVRLHSFIIQGMHDNFSAAAGRNITYYPYIEPSPGSGSGMVEYLTRHCCVVVTDDYPCFFLPRMLKAVSRRSPVLVEAIDSNGLLPMHTTGTVFPTAYAFRRYLQSSLAGFLSEMPQENCLKEVIPLMQRLPEDLPRRWPAASQADLSNAVTTARRIPVDRSVQPGWATGGSHEAVKQWRRFLIDRLSHYPEHRNQPDENGSSGLSPWLHFGHLSVHQMFRELADHEHWAPDRLGSVRQTRGSREGWWGMSSAAESFLDELVTWRELGFNMCSKVKNYDQYESLPEWAQQTLHEHASDIRPVTYDFEQLQNAATHDPLWNAAQNQLLTEGRMHNYLRMLWGKKILQWSHTPQQALKTMITLNNRFATDGRDPNSYSGIFWVLGRYDRAWGPERTIFGKIRYMTSENTARKLHLSEYLKRYSPEKVRGRLF